MSRRAPAGLGPRGRRFWLDVQRTYSLNVDEVELLVEMCRTLDLVEALAIQPVDVAVARELRQQRAELRHLAAALSLPDPTGEPAVESGNTKRARRAAEARWDKEA